MDENDMLMDAVRVASGLKQEWRNGSGRLVCLGNDIDFPGYVGSNKFYCGASISAFGSDGHCGTTAGPQCSSCLEFTSSPDNKHLIPAMKWSNDEGRMLCIGNNITYPGFVGVDKFYCGCGISSTDSDGKCGTRAGPQCSSCSRFTIRVQEAASTYLRKNKVTVAVSIFHMSMTIS
jgi:hypothetical protein